MFMCVYVSVYAGVCRPNLDRNRVFEGLVVVERMPANKGTYHEHHPNVVLCMHVTYERTTHHRPSGPAQYYT